MNHNPFARLQKSLILLALTAMFFSAFGGSSASVAFAQENASPDGLSALALVAGVDLEAANIELTPPDNTITTEFYVNDDIDISLTLINNGDTASGTFNIYFAVHADGVVPNVTCGGFNSAEWDYYVQAVSIEASTGEQTATQNWDVTIFANTLATGDYQVTAFVDSDCEVAETDENNNVFTTPTFTVNPAPVPPPANDDFANAEEITTLPFADTFDPSGATREVSDPDNLSCHPTPDNLDAGLATVWYSYTPISDQILVLSTIGSGYDTYIAVFEDGNPLQLVDCNDDADILSNPSVYQSRLPIALSSGIKYYFLIGQFSVDFTSDGVTSQAASDNLTFSIGDGYEISGNTSEPDVTLSYIDGFTKTVTSDVNGDYSIIVPPNWSGTVTPSKTGVAFAPSSRDYTNIIANQVDQDYVIAVTSTFKSYGPHDGWILESGEKTNKGGALNTTEKYFILGDDKANRQYRAILSFDTSSLPEGAVIVSATLRIKIRGRIKGTNPFLTHQNIMMDINQGGFSNNTDLQTRDFKVRGSKNNAGQITDTPVSGWYSGSVNAPGLPYINTAGYTQFRLRFRLDDNNDNGIDTINFSSGNAPGGARPQLIIMYYLP